MKTGYTLACSAILAAVVLGQVDAITQARPPASAQLWGKLPALREARAAQFAYLDGVPISGIPDRLNSAHAAVAQALLYLDFQYGFIASRHQRRPTTDADLVAEVQALRKAPGGIPDAYPDEVIVSGLLALSEDNEKAYARSLRGLPELSETGYLAHLFAKTQPSGPPRLDYVLSGIVTVAKNASYRIPAETLAALSFEMLATRLQKREIVVMAGDAADTWATLVGTFIDGDTKYVVVHEPRSARQMRPTDEMIATLRGPEPPVGTQIYPYAQTSYKGAIALGAPLPDPEALRRRLDQMASATNGRRGG